MGWLIEVAPPAGKHEQWVARIGHRASEPLPLDKAKQAAVAMLREGGKAESRDWIGDLNKIVAAEIDRLGLAEARQQWPRDLVGGSRRGSVIWIDREKRNAIFDVELRITSRKPLSGDDYPIEYYEDGFPKLPAFLDRRKPKPSATSQNSATTKKPQQLALPGPPKE